MIGRNIDKCDYISMQHFFGYTLSIIYGHLCKILAQLPKEIELFLLCGMDSAL